MPVLEELKQLSDERFLELYKALDVQGFGPFDMEVAKALKFRPPAIKKLPFETRARHAKRLMVAKNQADLAYDFFGSYLLRTKKELVTGFLDATGVPHEDGMIEDLEAKLPDTTKLDGALAELDQKFPPADVTLYLAMCTEQWPALAELRSAWQRRRSA